MKKIVLLSYLSVASINAMQPPPSHEQQQQEQKEFERDTQRIKTLTESNKQFEDEIIKKNKEIAFISAQIAQTKTEIEKLKSETTFCAYFIGGEVFTIGTILSSLYRNEDDSSFRVKGIMLSAFLAAATVVAFKRDIQKITSD